MEALDHPKTAEKEGVDYPHQTLNIPLDSKTEFALDPEKYSLEDIRFLEAAAPLLCSLGRLVISKLAVNNDATKNVMPISVDSSDIVLSQLEKFRKVFERSNSSNGNGTKK